MNDEVWFDDDVSMRSYALLPDMDGDGAGEAAVVVGGVRASERTLAFFDPEVLASGATGASLEEALSFPPVSESRIPRLLSGRSGVGDVNGDGFHDVALLVWDDMTGDGANEYCVGHLLGATDLRSGALEDRLGGLACFEAAEGHSYGFDSRVGGGDLDRDGVADVVYSLPPVYASTTGYIAAACVIPSSRHPAAGWALMDEVRPYCVGSNQEIAGYGGLADLDGDGLPEILGSEYYWTDPTTPDEEKAGRILVMPGFEVPWDDGSRW